MSVMGCKNKDVSGLEHGKPTIHYMVIVSLPLLEHMCLGLKKNSMLVKFFLL